jgi:hypothetical protein
VLPDVTIALLAAIAGFMTTLCLLLLWLGDGSMTPETESDTYPMLDAQDETVDGPHSPFIPMPDHLKTRDDMVAWMTKELPRLVAEKPTPHV